MVVCSACQRRLPPSLIKAVNDSFIYALKLRTGEVLEFEYATLEGEYATLHGNHRLQDRGGEYGFRPDELPFACPRGVDVRIADIVWCADAPNGS